MSIILLRNKEIHVVVCELQMGKGEDVLLVMNNVRHKKNDGALYIMASRVAWMPDGKEVRNLNSPNKWTFFSQIKDQHLPC